MRIIHYFFATFLVAAASQTHAGCFDKFLGITETQKQYSRIQDQMANHRQQLATLSADHYNKTFSRLQGFDAAVRTIHIPDEQIEEAAQQFRQDLDTLLATRKIIMDSQNRLVQQAKALEEQIHQEKMR